MKFTTKFSLFNYIYINNLTFIKFKTIISKSNPLKLIKHLLCSPLTQLVSSATLHSRICSSLRPDLFLFCFCLYVFFSFITNWNNFFYIYFFSRYEVWRLDHILRSRFYLAHFLSFLYIRTLLGPLSEIIFKIIDMHIYLLNCLLLRKMNMSFLCCCDLKITMMYCE